MRKECFHSVFSLRDPTEPLNRMTITKSKSKRKSESMNSGGAPGLTSRPSALPLVAPFGGR
jgi:hypothetical protein